MVTENKSIIEISIARNFTKTPGPRYKKDGKYSGEEFRESFLAKYFSDPNDETEIIIDLDGVDGYPSSFLEEAFGGLVRIYGYGRVKKKIKFKAVKLKFFVEQAEKYIEDAKNNL
jgi:hypothetical protein